MDEFDSIGARGYCPSEEYPRTFFPPAKLPAQPADNVSMAKLRATYGRPMGVFRATLLFLAVALTAAAERSPTKTVILNGESVSYQVQGEWAVTEGDIILGPAAEIEAIQKNPKAPIPRAAAVYLDTVGTPQSWPGGVIPYTISPSLPDPQRVHDAIAHWNTRTPLRLVPRAGQANYVEFVLTGQGCSAALGMVGGRQTINLSPSSFQCPTSAVIHEIGHAFGLLHEQSRQDRNQWLTVLYENIDSGSYRQFRQEAGERDFSYYDYDSIMHYSWYGFSIDGLTSLESVPAGIPFGETEILSAQDIDSISRAYGIIPTATTITTIPAGLTIVVDGESYTAPHAFSWAPGSTHNISVADRLESGSGSLKIRNQFVRWTDGGGLSHSYTASANRTVVAAEFQQWFPVAPSVSGPGTVSLDPPSADGYYHGGAMITLRAHANNGAAFLQWTGDDTEFYEFGQGAEELRIPVREILTFRANFTTQPVTTITASRPGRKVTVDDESFSTPVRFVWTPGSQHKIGSDLLQYTFSDTTEFEFNGWSDGTLTRNRTITASSAAVTYQANFLAGHYLDVNWTGAGFVNTPAGYYDEGSTVTLTATPAFSQSLQYWLGDTAGSAITQSLTMDRPKRAFAVFGQRLQFQPVNAGSYSSNPHFEESGTNVAPLEILAVFGDNVGPPGMTLGFVGNDGRLSTTVGNTRILFDGVAAPILYASQTVTAVIVPAEVAGRVFTAISVVRNGQTVAIDTATVVDTLPGIFTADSSGRGNVAAFNEDGTLNSPANPAARGSVVVLYATGAGLMDRALPNGTIMGFDLARPQAPVSVRMAWQSARVEYAGSVPSLVHGALQVNARVPEFMPIGQHPIALVVGNQRSAPGPMISVK